METQYQDQYIRFGLKIQYYRKLRGMTQEDFADRIGKSWSFVAKIESMAEVLEVPVSKLFED